MKHLLCIQSHGNARNIVFRHWPYYKRSGADILGFDTSDRPHDWPEKTPSACMGTDVYFLQDKEALPRRLIACLAYCVENPEFAAYDTFCMIEADGLFVRPLPAHPGGLVATMAGDCDPRWKVKGKFFLHTPWWADRETAKKIIECGRKEIIAGEFENGSPDVWLGYLVDKYQIPYHEAHAFSINPRDLRDYKFLIKRMLDAASSGVYYIHGVHEDSDFIELEKGLKARGLGA